MHRLSLHMNLLTEQSVAAERMMSYNMNERCDSEQQLSGCTTTTTCIIKYGNFDGVHRLTAAAAHRPFYMYAK
jgi:carboxypeptidase C (cathepsin A)